MLEKEISNIPKRGLGSCVFGEQEFFIEVNLELKINFPLFVFLVVQGDLFPGICQRIRSNGKKL